MKGGKRPYIPKQEVFNPNFISKNGGCVLLISSRIMNHWGLYMAAMNNDIPILKKRRRRELFCQTFNFHLSMVNYCEREKKGAEKGFSFPQWFLLSALHKVTCLHLGKIPCSELFLKLPLTALKRNSKKTPQGTAAGLIRRTVSSLVNTLLPKGRRKEEGESFKI